MTAPGNVTGEKLAFDYLAQLTRAAMRYLPKGDRMKFVGRTRALIERRAGPLRLADAALVAEVLAELGDPVDLVKRERARIDEAWARRRAKAQNAGSAAPWEQRPLTSRWHPATGDRPRPRSAGRIKGWLRGQFSSPAGPGSGTDSGQEPAAAGPAAAGPAVAGLGPAAADGGQQAGGQESTPAPGGAAAGGGVSGPASRQASNGVPRPGGESGNGAARNGRTTGHGAGLGSLRPWPPGPQVSGGETGRTGSGGTGPGDAPAGAGPVAGAVPGEDAGAGQAAGAGAGHDAGAGSEQPASSVPGKGAGPGPRQGAGVGPPAGTAPGQDEPAAQPASPVPSQAPLPAMAEGPAAEGPPAGSPEAESAAGPPTIPGLPILEDPVLSPDSPTAHLIPVRGPASRPPGTVVPLTPAGLGTLARAQRREAVAVVLLAAGLLLPLPCWPLGALVAGFSRFWEARDKWLAWLGPALAVLVLTIPIAAIARGHGNPVVIYLHLLRVDAHYLVRAGCLAVAAYLGWRVRRGPRVRVPPWRRHG